MTTQRHNFLLISLISAVGALVACDGSEDMDAASEAFAVTENGDILPGTWPPADQPLAAEVNALSATPATSQATSQGFPPKHHVTPTEDLVIDWLRWALAQPYAAGPICDSTGEHCGMGQEGPNWFLAGTFGGPATRECDVPAGKTLFFPLVNRWVVFPDEYYPNQEAIDATIPLAANWFDASLANTCELTLRIDGQEVMPFDSLVDELYIRILEPFEIELNDEHWATDWFAGGTMPAVGDGHYARIQPLTAGDHVIELGGSICGDNPFSTSVTYLLHVGPAIDGSDV